MVTLQIVALIVVKMVTLSHDIFKVQLKHFTHSEIAFDCNK